MEEKKEMTALQKTQMYLENYREMERYIKDAISEVSQIDDISRYNISAERAFLQSIRECRAETVILFEHMNKAWYDKDIKERHVTLWDLGESDDNFSDDDAEGVTLSVQVTIFSRDDEVELAGEIKSLMKQHGFSFEGRNGDDSKPEDGIYMKAQRFSKYYESEEQENE